mmetsp:Transcript_948/g.2202  ORF Transcript_948/g.2202 Transcript_948/m.2202 type:complete len:204 (-) Transcript_948:9-620(-)
MVAWIASAGALPSSYNARRFLRPLSSLLSLFLYALESEHFLSPEMSARAASTVEAPREAASTAAARTLAPFWTALLLLRASWVLDSARRTTLLRASLRNASLAGRDLSPLCCTHKEERLVRRGNDTDNNDQPTYSTPHSMPIPKCHFATRSCDPWGQNGRVRKVFSPSSLSPRRPNRSRRASYRQGGCLDVHGGHLWRRSRSS